MDHLMFVSWMVCFGKSVSYSFSKTKLSTTYTTVTDFLCSLALSKTNLQFFIFFCSYHAGAPFNHSADRSVFEMALFHK